MDDGAAGTMEWKRWKTRELAKITEYYYRVNFHDCIHRPYTYTAMHAGCVCAK